MPDPAAGDHICRLCSVPRVVLTGADNGAPATQSCGEKVTTTAEAINRAEQEEEESYNESFHGSAANSATFKDILMAQ